MELCFCDKKRNVEKYAKNAKQFGEMQKKTLKFVEFPVVIYIITVHAHLIECIWRIANNNTDDSSSNNNNRKLLALKTVENLILSTILFSIFVEIYCENHDNNLRSMG